MKRKFNYRITVNINQKMMHLGLRCYLPKELEGKDVRVQAIFKQRQVDRRFAMDTHLTRDELGALIMADRDIELPYVFYRQPKNTVDIIFSLWCDGKEYLLEDQPFPVEKDMFKRNEGSDRRNLPLFCLSTVGLPVLALGNYVKNGHDMKKALKQANANVYQISGYSYSPRQRNTDYFNIQYKKAVAKYPKMSGRRILFLSERLPEEGGNLMRVKAYLEKNPTLLLDSFMVTKPVNALSKRELKDCARLCAKADVIILEDFYPQLHRLNIRKETKVVQLWHACGAFKTFGLTRAGKPGCVEQSSMNHRNYDFVPVSSEMICPIYAEAFGIPGNKVKALGVPRTDVCFDYAYQLRTREALYDKYPMLKGKKVVLFAPTFRGHGNQDAYYPEEAFDVTAFLKNLPEDVFCIVKHHPFVKQPLQVAEAYKDRVLDLTGKDLINDLMLVSDLLITDYSSSIFEASLLKLPILFYAFDEKEYMESRDFYYSFESFVPGLIAHNFTELTDLTGVMLQGAAFAGEEERKEKEEKFREGFLSALDGHSTERICDYIEDTLLVKEATSRRDKENVEKERHTKERKSKEKNHMDLDLLGKV